jgi:hypothetical protein
MDGIAKRSIFTGLIFIAVIISIGFFTSHVQTTTVECEAWKDNLTEYMSSSGQFGIQYPDTTGWQFGGDAIIRTTDESPCSKFELRFSSLGPVPFNNLKVLTNIDLKETVSFASDALVEPLNLSKYVIDGEPMASYTYKDLTYEGQTKDFVERGFTIHDGELYSLVFTYSLGFRNDYRSEPDPEALEIKDYILSSIRWLK